MVEYASTLRYPDGLGNKRLYRPRTCSFINSWLILYLLVIKLVEAGHHLLIILKQRRTQGDSAKKLQELDPIQLEGGPKGVHADIGSLKKVQKYGHLGELKSFLHFDRLSVTIKPVHWGRKSVCF